MRPSDGYTVRHPDRPLARLVVLAISHDRALFDDGRPVARAPLARGRSSEISRPITPTIIRMIPTVGDARCRRRRVDGEREDRPDGDQEE